MKIKARWNMPPLPRKTFDATLFMIAVIMQRLVSAFADILGSCFGNCLTSKLCPDVKKLNCIDSSGAADSSRSEKWTTAARASSGSEINDFWRFRWMKCCFSEVNFYTTAIIRHSLNIYNVRASWNNCRSLFFPLINTFESRKPWLSKLDSQTFMGPMNVHS